MLLSQHPRRSPIKYQFRLGLLLVRHYEELGHTLGFTFIACDCGNSNTDSSSRVVRTLTNFTEEWSALLIKAK